MEVAAEIIGKNSMKKYPQISNKTLEITERQYTARMLPDLSLDWHLNHLNNDITRGIGKDEAERLEEVTVHHDLKTLYKILYEAKVGPRQTMASGNEILDCWMDHFRNLLSHPPSSSEDLKRTMHLTDKHPVDDNAANNPIMESEVCTTLKSI